MHELTVEHQKFRDAEARILGQAGPLQWECELYVSSS